MHILKSTVVSVLCCFVLIPAVHASSKESVVTHYADIAHAVFEDSLVSALRLQESIVELVKAPNTESLAKARAAWVAAREPYQQSEVFRFGHSVVDEWEGQLNAWPLDEGLIDYVSVAYEPELGNDAGSVNIVASLELDLGGELIDLSSLTPKVLADLNELGGSEANVATGYHAIEFLLWGQDLNGSGAGAGNRPYTDYSAGSACTGGSCERRAAYINAVTQLLVEDLTYMEAQWRSGVANNYRTELLSINVDNGLNKMLFGMGSLALGELAGERMKVALEANSPEDEHDCFSDNTHNAHYFDAKGIENVFLGRYQRVDGSLISGPSIKSLVSQSNTLLADQAGATFAETEAALKAMVVAAESGMAFDQMIAEGNDKGEAIIARSIVSLVAETKMIEALAVELGLGILSPDTADHSF